MKDGKGKTTASLGRPGRSSEGAKMLREREDAALEAAGFERVGVEGSELWAKGGVCYGREAALQKSGIASEHDGGEE